MPFRFSLPFLLGTALLVGSVKSDTCSTLKSTHPKIILAFPGSAEYREEQKSYWSTACTYMKPTCLIFPSTSAEVVNVLDVLRANNEPFSVKGRGHNPNKHVASTDGGSIIVLSKMNEATYQNSTQTARVGPGNRWQDVVKALSPYGRTVVGGRIGHVGVPGLLLGGGLSFLSGQYGWASTHVVEYEVVLANGTVVKASKTANPELHRALQGGGSSLGIVTSFTLSTVPMGQIWGGTRSYSRDKTPQLLAAIRDFTEHYPDPKAGVIVTAESTAFGLLDLWVMFYFYDGPNPPGRVFENFTKITHTLSDTHTRSYEDFLVANNKFSLSGSVYTIATETMPLPSSQNGVAVMNEIFGHWKNTSAPVVSRLTGSIASIAYQPLPKLFSQMTKKHGGNLMDMGDEGDRIILEFDYSYLVNSAANEATVDQANQRLYGGMRDKIQGFVRQRALPDMHLPLFMNDAYFKQDYWGRSRERGFVQSVQKAVDPGGFWASRLAGWKL